MERNYRAELLAANSILDPRRPAPAAGMETRFARFELFRWWRQQESGALIAHKDPVGIDCIQTKSMVGVLATLAGEDAVQLPACEFLLAACGLHVRQRIPRVVHADRLGLEPSLQNRSTCVVEASLRNLMTMKSAVQAHQSEVQDLVHLNAKTLDAFEDDRASCLAALFDAIAPKSHISNTTETEPQASENAIQCFSSALHDQLYATTLNSHSREILDHTRLILLSRTAVETDREISQRLQNHPSDVIVTSLKSLFASFRQQLNAATLSGFHELFQNSSAAAGEGSQNGALSSLSSVDIENSAFPWLRMPDQTAFEALNIVITKLRKVLRSVAAKDELVQKLLHDVTEQGWQDLTTQVRSLQNQSMALQLELQHFVDTTWSHLNHSTETLRNSLQLIELETMTSISDLNHQWVRRTKIMVSSTLKLLQSVYNQLQSFTAVSGLQLERSRRNHYREVPLETLTDSEERAGKQQAYLLHQRDRLQLGNESNSSNAPSNVLAVGTTKIDLNALRDRFVVVGATIEYLVAWADVSWGVLKVLKLVVTLWTNSYSDLPVVDARGISTIQTLLLDAGAIK
ncbi:hypothetical protein FI667_g7321, partial [Globisporangium splendens]